MAGYGIHVGAFIVRAITYLGELTVLLGKTLYASVTPPFNSARTLAQARRVGMGSFSIAILIAFFIGIIMTLQMARQMTELSAEIYIPRIVAVSLTRELAPVLTALIVAGRIGAGITAELGTMTVTEQVDALRAFAVNPVRYLVVPRFVALVVMLPVLAFFADVVGMFGSFMICVNKLGITPALFISTVTDSLEIRDVVTGLIKTIFFGATIALVGCREGLQARSGAEGVGRSTTVSVVVSFILIIMIDCFFTTLFYFVFNA